MRDVCRRQQRDLRRLQPKTGREAVKYFVKGRMPEGWCALTYPQSGFTLRLAFPVEQVPYLAVLPNEGGWQDLYNIFLEPATASFDRLDIARVRGECSTSGPTPPITGTWTCALRLKPDLCIRQEESSAPWRPS